MLQMKERVTIAVDPEVLKIARAEVESGRATDLSTAIEEALRARARSEGLREAIELSEKEHGPVSREKEEWAIRELLRASREISSSTPEH
jgi:Arc/MetJ-type ribon-helix-helix transcriptional regulator